MQPADLAGYDPTAVRRVRWTWILCWLALWCSPRIASAEGPYVVLFVLDGCRADRFAEALSAGELPNIQRYFVRDGAHFRYALAPFPSATPTGYQAMVSGLFPGHAGIPYLEWFDREARRVVPFLSLKGPTQVNASFRNFYAPTRSRTLYDDLAGQPTAAVYSMFSRNAMVQRPQRAPVDILWSTFVTRRMETLDRAAWREVWRLYTGPMDVIPIFTQIGLLTTDGLGHKLGALSPQIRENLRLFDRRIGEFVALLKERELFDRTYIIITADHGMHDIDGVFGMRQFLVDHGLRPVRAGRDRDRADVYVGERGIGSATISVRGPEGWTSRPSLAWLRAFPLHGGATIDLIALLRRAPALALVGVRDGADRVRLYQANNEAAIRVIRDHDGRAKYAYTFEGDGWDPLGFADDPRLRRYRHGQFLTPEQWLALSKEADYPDAVVQLGQILADGRAGDLFVISHPQWEFYRKKAGTHGTHAAVDMRVPLLIRGPRIRPGQYDVARIVDLYPTIRQWFGLGEPAAPIDGRILPITKHQIPNTK